MTGAENPRGGGGGGEYYFAEGHQRPILERWGNIYRKTEGGDGPLGSHMAPPLMGMNERIINDTPHKNYIGY